MSQVEWEFMKISPEIKYDTSTLLPEVPLNKVLLNPDPPFVPPKPKMKIVYPREVWKRVPYPDIKPLYASNYGKIRNERGKILKPTDKGKNTYVSAVLKETGKRREIKVSQAIQIAFIGEPDAPFIYIV